MLIVSKRLIYDNYNHPYKALHIDNHTNGRLILFIIIN